MKVTYAHLEGSSQETGHSIILRLVIGSSAYTGSVKVNQFVGRGIQDPCCRSQVGRPAACPIRVANVTRWKMVHLWACKDDECEIMVKKGKNKKKGSKLYNADQGGCSFSYG